MRILLFNTFYYPKFVGGAEISVQLLAEGLVKKGHQTYVLTIGNRNEVARLNGVVIIRIRSKNISSVYNDKQHGPLGKAIWLLLDSFNPFYHYRLSTILKRIKPDVVHTNNVMGFSPVIWLTVKRFKLPLVHTLRDYYLLCHKCNMFNGGSNCEQLCGGCKITHQLKKSYLRKPDVFVGVSRYVLNKHVDFIKFSSLQKREVVYNAVDIPSIDPRPKNKKKITLGFMGRISEDKGVEYLVEELKKVATLFPDTFELLLAGKGEEQYIEQLKHKMQGVDYKFLGKIEPNRFYEEVELTIVPSKWQEPFGRVVIESLSYGVPVCMSASGGLLELHREDCTWLFKPYERDLSTVLIEVLKNRPLLDEKRTNARNRASEFSIDENITKYLEIYNMLQQ